MYSSAAAGGLEEGILATTTSSSTSSMVVVHSVNLKPMASKVYAQCKVEANGFEGACIV